MFISGNPAIQDISSYYGQSPAILLYLQLSHLLSYLGQSGTILVYIGLSWAVSDYFCLSMPISAYLGFSQAVSGYLGQECFFCGAGATRQAEISETALD